MREPWAWLGWLVVAGAWSWPWWTPAAAPLLAGTAHLCLLAWLGREARAAWAALAVAAFLLGAAAPAGLPPHADGSHLRGVITASSTRRAVLSTGSGQAELWFPDVAPRPGTRVAAWTAPASAWVHLPGALDGTAGLARAHRTRRRVREWVTLREPARQPTLDRWLAPWISRQEPRDAGWYGQAVHGGLLWALVSGERQAVPEDTAALLRRTGTAHLLAISGMHIGLVASAAWGMTRWLSRPLAALAWPWPGRALPALAACAAAFGYASAVGWPVSARRAATMVVAVAAARLLGRQAKLWTLLGLSAAGITLSDPAQVGELGFWMSFGAVAGILSWSHAATRWLPPDRPRWLGWLGGALGATLGATLGTLPVTAWVFQQLSPLTLLTNLVAGPLMAGVAVPAALAAGQLPGALGPLALAVADGATRLTLQVLGALDVPPWTPAVGPVGAVLLALVLPLRRWPGAAAGLVVVALGLRPVPTTLQVTFLAVGQGDAALVEWPDGTRWLIDGGPPSTRLLHYLRRRGIRRLDAIVLSHPHPDHMGGLLPVVESLEVGALWVSRPPEHDERAYRDLWTEAFAQHVPIRTPEDTMTRATLLHPLGGWTAEKKRRRVNEESIVLRIDHGASSFLFTGDIEVEAEAHLADSLQPVTVVKVPHHGSTSSSSPALVSALRAEYAVIPCGVDNRFRHPRPLTLHRWRGATVLRTDLEGSIRFTSDGEHLTVETLP